jgi:hypothetical protein
MSRPKMTDEQKAAAAAKRQAALLEQAVTVAREEPETVEVATAPELPSLADYIAARERDSTVLVRVTYPGAQPHVFQGKFSGVVVADGPLSAQWSDGATE